MEPVYVTEAQPVGRPAATFPRNLEATLSGFEHYDSAPLPSDNPAIEQIKEILLSEHSPLGRSRRGPDGRRGPKKLTALDKEYVMASLRPWQQNKYHPHDFYLAHRPSRPDDIAPSDEKLAKFVYSTTPKQLNKHLKHIQEQKRAQIESMFHDREVHDYKLRIMAAQQRQAFNTLRSTVAAKYQSAGLPAPAIYSSTLRSPRSTMLSNMTTPIPSAENSLAFGSPAERHVLPQPHPRQTHQRMTTEAQAEVPAAAAKHASVVAARRAEAELLAMREEVQHLEAFEDKMNKYLLRQQQRQAMLSRKNGGEAV